MPPFVADVDERAETVCDECDGHVPACHCCRVADEGRRVCRYWRRILILMFLLLLLSSVISCCRGVSWRLLAGRGSGVRR